VDVALHPSGTRWVEAGEPGAPGAPAGKSDELLFPVHEANKIAVARPAYCKEIFMLDSCRLK
jgi:hypothetical protein